MEDVQKYYVGNTVVNLAERVIEIEGQSFAIEPKANALLKLLIENSNDVVSRDDILEFVFPAQVVSYSSVNRLIAILRKVFNNDTDKDEYIKTIAKAGYKLQVEVKACVSIADSGKQNHTIGNQDQIALKRHIESTNTLNRKSRNFHYYTIALAASIVSLGLFFFSQLNDPKTESSCVIPNNWYVAGSNPDQYLGCLDNNIGVPAPSVYFKNKVKNPEGFLSFAQGAWLEKYRGKNVKLSASVKSNNLDGHAGLYLRADPKDFSKDDVLAFINSGITGNLIMGTQEWKTIELVLHIPEATNRLNYGIYFSGEGEFWLDKVSIDVTTDKESKRLPIKRNSNPKNLEFSGT